MTAYAAKIRTLFTAAPILIVGIATSSVPVDAQVFTGLAPARPFVLPEMGAVTARTPAVAAAPATTSERRRLATPAHGWRLAGESDSRFWRAALTAAEARTIVRFEVGYIAAASVVPENSFLKLEINGRNLRDVGLVNPGGIRHATFEIPAGLLTEGINTLRLSARTRHRVDCSVEATYELWIQIDPDTTGFLLSGDSEGVAQIDDLAATHPDMLGEIPIRVVLGQQRLSSSGASAAIAAAEALSLAAGLDHTSVDFGPPLAGDGLNVLVGPVAGFDPGMLPADFGAVEGPRLAVLPATAERRPTLVVTGTNEADVAQATQALAAMRAKPGVGLKQLKQRLSGGERIALRDLGVVDQNYTGRLFRMPFDIVLPRDFMAADYAKAELDLAGAYPPGLAAGAQLRIEVNGADAASVDLRTTGEVFAHKQIFFPLSRLRPGRNRITIAAALPEPSDAACEAVAEGRRRFQLLASSELVLPPIARVVRLPDLVYTAQSGYPFAESARPVILHVPNPDRATMGAVATLATRIAIAADALIPFVVSILPPPPGVGAIVIGPGPAIAEELWTAGGLDPQAIRTAWTNRSLAPAEPSMSARHGHILRDDGVAACTTSAEQTRARDVDVDRPPAGAGDIAALIAAARTWSPFGQATARNVDLGAASLVVSEGAPAAGASAILIVVSAPSAPELAQSMSCLVDPRVWDGLAGQTAILAAGTERVASTPASQARFVTTERLSAGNLRLIAAGWLSLNPGCFAALVAAAAGFLALCTYWLVGNIGRKA